MSYHEAKSDGVRITSYQGRTVYFPRCAFCGDEVFSYNYLRTVQYTCRECRPWKSALLASGILSVEKPDRVKDE